MFWRPAAGGRRPHNGSSERPLHREREEDTRGPESSFVRGTWLCMRYWGGDSPLHCSTEPSDKAKSNGLPRLYKFISVKSCFEGLSCFASTFSATIFHCSVLTSQTAFSRENSVLPKVGSRSKCCYI